MVFKRAVASRLARWTVAVGLTLIVFGVLLWMVRSASFSWLPQAESDRWMVATAFAAAGGGVVAAGTGWWAGREVETYQKSAGSGALGSGALVLASVAHAHDDRPHAAPEFALRMMNTLPPALVEVLMGRGRQIDQLMGLLDPSSRNPAPTVLTVTGLGGVGKTELAVHCGHIAVARGWFPGGALYLDLQGYSPKAQLTPEQAVERFLVMLTGYLGVLPETPTDQLGLLRLLLAQLAARGRPLLLIADNAASVEQVMPLIPAARQHRLVVTSRDTLAELPHARLIDLDQLDPGPAVELITTILLDAWPEDPRPVTESEAVTRLAELCGGLPLALDIIARILRYGPGRSVADLVRELEDARARLSRRMGDADGGPLSAVRAAFDLSYRRLTAGAARLFRLLALNPGPDIATDAVVALLGRPVRQTTALLQALARTHLVKEQPVGCGRWRMHDLIRLYAADLVADDPYPAQRELALDRLLKHYRVIAQAAEIELRFRPRPDGIAGNQKKAVTWLSDERANLVDAVTLADATGRGPVAISIALSTAYFLLWHRRLDDALSSSRTAVLAAERIGDAYSIGAAANNLGLAFKELHRFDDAIVLLNEARKFFQALGDQRNDARALSYSR